VRAIDEIVIFKTTSNDANVDRCPGCGALRLASMRRRRRSRSLGHQQNPDRSRCSRRFAIATRGRIHFPRACSTARRCRAGWLTRYSAGRNGRKEGRYAPTADRHFNDVGSDEVRAAGAPHRVVLETRAAPFRRRRPYAQRPVDRERSILPLFIGAGRDSVARVSEERTWECARCNGAVACVFCESCALHCTSLRPNALQAHRRRGQIFVAPWPRFELANEHLSQEQAALLAQTLETAPDGTT
jgi:hypothetical protein